MPAYYNEKNAYAAQWLRNLEKAGHIAAGDIDERPIEAVSADDIRGYDQCHFFAGIGGWSLALRLAGWPDARPVWTGSCPCQPFTGQGKRLGFADKRHMWPAWFPLIRECRPPAILGEQVAGAGLWLDNAFADLEDLGYACGAADLPAACTGSPQNRPRLWFVSDATGGWLQTGSRLRKSVTEQDRSLAANRSWWNAEPGLARVADGIPGLVEQRRAFGNAIVAQVAAEFITSVYGNH